VTFKVDTTDTTNNACSVSGSQITFLNAGTCVIDADQAGDNNYTAATEVVSSPINVVAGVAKVTLTVSPSTGTNAGKKVTLTAKIKSVVGNVTPTGTVTFRVNGKVIAGCQSVQVSSAKTPTASCTTKTLPVGTDALSADYSGDSTYGLTSSVAQGYIIEKKL
jgi:uncharacterized ParB-like nuclease family protein